MGFGNTLSNFDSEFLAHNCHHLPRLKISEKCSIRSHATFLPSKNTRIHSFRRVNGTGNPCDFESRDTNPGISNIMGHESLGRFGLGLISLGLSRDNNLWDSQMPSFGTTRDSLGQSRPMPIPGKNTMVSTIG